VRVVWKFPLTAYDVDLSMPVGAKVVHVAWQEHIGLPMVWAEVSTEAATEIRHFTVVGTGHPIADGYWHVGSWLDRELVFHLYEAKAADL